jgi:hypothetical protein
MKYRATCPTCASRLARSHYYHFGRDHCEHCHAIIKPQASWEWIGTTPFSVFMVVGFGLAFFGVVSWLWAIALTALILLAGYLAFPWVTPYDLVTRGEGCRKCGYDLYGLESLCCPECGSPREDPLTNRCS